MVKHFYLRETQRAFDVLNRIRETIDPNAFIAGGFAAQLYLGASWSTDIDIFFSSPNFDYSALGGSAFKQLRVVLGNDLKSADYETYWYNKRFCRVGKLPGIDLIQINKAPKNAQEYVLEKFDINLCKVTAVSDPSYSGSEFRIISSAKFIEGLNSKRLIYDLNLADYSYESKLQAKITNTRVTKYLERFPGFELVEDSSETVNDYRS